MKRILSMLLASLMVLTMAVVLVVPTSAALEGDWDTARSGSDYDEDADSHCPEPGYHYDSKLGFVVDSPEYLKTPFMQAHTKNPVNLKVDNDGKGNSVSLKFTVLDYAYANGENIDQWIAITLNSQKLSTPGSVDYGEGICILIRRNLSGNDLGEGRAQFETFYVDKSGQDGAPKNFGLISGNGFGLVQGDVPVVDGHEEYTFSVQYTDAGYVLNANGLVMGPDPYLNKILDNACADGAYVSVMMQTGVPGGKASIAITEWQGDIPVGDDSKLPEEDERAVAPIAPSDNIPANEPAVLWSTARRDHRKVEMAGAVVEELENGSVKVTTQTVSPYVSFGVKSAVSYEAADFPIIAVLTRNCWANSGNCYYMAGEKNLNASEDFRESWSTDDVTYADGWALGFVDLSYYVDEDPEIDGGWEGRINGVRVGFDFSAEDVGDEEYGTFEIGFIGAFRSTEEAEEYAKAYLTNLGVDPNATTEEQPEEPTTEADTEAKTEGETDGKTEATTEKKTEAKTEGTTAAEQTSGCGAIVAAPVVALVAILGVAFVAKKKD